MKFSLLILFVTVANLASAMPPDEVYLTCTSTDSTHILPFGDDSVLDVEINRTFGGYLSITGDAGISSHLKYKKTQNSDLIFISVEPQSDWQAKNLQADVDEELLDSTPGEIHFTSLDDPTITKLYSCQENP